MVVTRSTETFQLGPTSLPGLLLMRAASGRSLPRHAHDVYGIGLIDAGGQRSASGRGVVEALQGDVITVNPGEVHDGVALQGVPRRWRMLYIAPGLLGTDASSPEWTAPALRDAPVAGLVHALFAVAEQGEDALALEQGLASLLQRVPGNRPAERVPADAGLVLRRVRERLADALDDPPSLAELAAEAGLSRFQLLRAFSRAFGLPPHGWVVQCRLARVRRCIALGQTLADAALDAGFADQSHMTRHFVRCMGYSPGAYAQAVRAR